MESWPGVLALGAAAFISTNVDGLLVLMVFFADSEFAPAQIAAGQLAATALWIVISVAASAAALALPTHWLALLGLVPIVLGLTRLKVLRASGDEPAEERTAVEAEKDRSLRRTHSRVGAVALIALANGGDNVAVYVALFATSTPTQIAAFSGVFLGLATVWCVAAYWLVRRTWLGVEIERYGERALPVVLIALGLYIVGKGLAG